MKKIFIRSSLIAVTLATPSVAEPTELDKKTVASKAYVDTKQDKIETEMVEFNDNPEYMLPAITTYDSTSGLVANKIGILDQETIANNEGDLYLYSNGGGGYGSEMDNFVPTVRAVAESLHAIRSDLETFQWSDVKHPAAINAYSTTFDGTTANWPRDDVGKLVETGTFAKALALKQNILPAKWTSTTSSLQMGAKGGQTIELNTAGNVKRRYITAGGSVGLTTRSGAPAVINYVNGTVATTEDMTTFTTGTFGSSNTTNQNYIKNALVSLELLKDVYGELNSKITNNALPTGTTGTVVTYNGVNAETGVQEFGERAVYDPTNTYNAQNDATKLATMASVKYVCAGYEPAAAGQPAHDGTHPGDEDYCWLWTLPN